MAFDSADVDALTRAAAQGDREALESLLENYLPDLRAFVRLRAGRAVRARESGSDLVQSVCREVLEHAGAFRHASESAFKRWLFTTALRKIMNRRDYLHADKRDARRDAGQARVSAGDALLLERYSSFSTPSRHAMLREEVERIESAMEDLSDDHRTVITLAHVVGLSRAEIAEEMGKSEGAVRTLLHRALARLAVRLGGPEE
jgi:RNA polymerase sigma-70 factor (ECF subfamily)